MSYLTSDWTKLKFNEGKYKSSDIYGSPHDPVLIKEYEDFLKQKLGVAKYEEYMHKRGKTAPK